MKKNRVFATIAIALLLGLAGRHAAMAQQPTPPHSFGNGENDEISINFRNAAIIEVIDVMSRVTGKNFIVDPAVKGSVTVIAPQNVPKGEAYGVFESILEMNGFSLVSLGNIIKVVPSRAAIQRNIPVKKGREFAEVREGDQIITQLVPIRYSEAQAITTVLTPLISRDANLTAYANTNTIIMTESSSNIRRLLEIIAEIDVPGFERKITIIPLINAQADILSQEILQALEPGPGAAARVPSPRTRRRTPAQVSLTGTTTQQIKIISDLRTNSLIVVANEIDTEQVKFLVGELDKVTPVEANNIHVYRLENALAEDVAAVLTSLATTTTPAAGRPGGGAAAAVSGVRTFYKEVSVVADKTTNSLIIIATPQDYTVLKRVIDQLDVMRPQVLVETLIAEVSMDFTRDLGIRWQLGIPHGDDQVGFAAVNPVISNIPDLGDLGDGLDLGALASNLLPGGLSIGYVNVDGNLLRAFVELNALESDSDFNVLSAPHVLTLDNEKAVINISDNVPFITSRLTDNTGSDALAQSETFEYRDVGIVLEITPHISPDRMVRLEIVQKVNDVSQVASGLSAGALSEIKREAETTVMVKDRHTLVLGGLMKDTDTVSYTKVPFLGDIPVLGWAFKSKSVTRGKKNLLIFITPSIVTSVAEAAELTLEKTSEAGEELRERMKDAPTFQRSKFLGEEARAPEDAPYEAGPK